jgi:hypothetical protein
MSSYSYMVVPTTTAAPFNEDKGRTLSTFINYFLCGGQQKADILGYSPLPANLVTAGFEQVARIPGAVPSPAISQCNNPALNILKSAPQPNPCMKVGSTCTPGTTATTGTSPTPGATPTDGAKPGATGSGGADPLGTGGGGGSGGSGDPLTGATDDPGGSSAQAADPLTGAQPTGTDATATDGEAQPVAAGPLEPVALAASRDGRTPVVAWLVAAMLALTVLAPPFLVARTARRRK